jgi:uncharacterized secreted protein with C-terminal beta-propeller domain
MAAIFGLLVIQHIGIEIYNNNVQKQNDRVINNPNKELTKIDTTKDISSQLNYISGKKMSALELIFSMQLMGCGAGTKVEDNMGSMIPEEENSYNTNIQENGIDEADTAKCDGKYIYSLVDNSKLCVFDLTGKIVDNELTKAFELYVYNDKIVCIGWEKTEVFSFDGVSLTLIETIGDKGMYLTSRLINNELYVVTRDYLSNILNQDSLANLYYDNCINPTGVVSMYNYNLDTNELNSVEVITAYSAILYASNNNFYIASRIYSSGNYSFITIIDYDLNPIGSITVEGTINNQFSMDEYNTYLRVVSTDTSKDPLHMNQISIFSLETLERVGYLNEGIGLEHHTVRSVRYDEDTCYVVTYMNKDPLYEIDLSDVTNPKIVSIYESPGYSTYLHTFTINEQKYAFGIGYDDRGYIKISVYIDNGNETKQIGKDVVITTYRGISSTHGNVDYYIVDSYTSVIADNHKSLFIYNDDNYLYVGGYVSGGHYAFFKIDVTQEERVISVYKEYKNVNVKEQTRAFLVDGKLYVVETNSLIIDDWN